MVEVAKINSANWKSGRCHKLQFLQNTVSLMLQQLIYCATFAYIFWM